jgi:hypothetical protein
VVERDNLSRSFFYVQVVVSITPNKGAKANVCNQLKGEVAAFFVGKSPLKDNHSVGLKKANLARFEPAGYFESQCFVQFSSNIKK